MCRTVYYIARNLAVMTGIVQYIPASSQGGVGREREQPKKEMAHIKALETYGVPRENDSHRGLKMKNLALLLPLRDVHTLGFVAFISRVHIHICSGD